MNADPGFWAGRSVFITGATGLVGSWLTPKLMLMGAKVIALVRDAQNGVRLRDKWIDRMIVIKGDLSDDVLIRRAFAEHSIQTVFHLGAQTQVGAAKQDPLGTLEANVRGTWLMLEAARQTRIEQILIASSGSAYGDSGELPHREDQPLKARFPYDVSKACTDIIAAMYAQNFAIPAAIVRCGNLFGGGDMNFGRLIPGIIRATLNNEPFRLRSDGSSVRDFFYVEDAVEAYLCLAEQMASDSSLHGEAFNFGLQLRWTMQEITEKVLTLMGKADLRPVFQDIATGETREHTLDVTKARERLQWSPRYGMEQGLQLTIDWYTRFFDVADKEPAVCSTAAA